MLNKCNREDIEENAKAGIQLINIRVGVEARAGRRSSDAELSLSPINEIYWLEKHAYG
jgi:hypothetical protein